MADDHNRALQNRFFDRFAEAASEIASHARFFVACVLLVVLWVPSYLVFGSVDTWQLVINTATTIVTFLMVALLQNAQRRSDIAMHRKLDALADGLADFMEHAAPDGSELERECASFDRPSGSSAPEARERRSLTRSSSSDPATDPRRPVARCRPVPASRAVAAMTMLGSLALDSPAGGATSSPNAVSRAVAVSWTALPGSWRACWRVRWLRPGS